MDNLLAIDTATDACSVALLRAGEISERFEVIPRRHNQRLQVLLQELLGSGDLRAQGIDAIVYGAGPGSFTGLRIAASAVQGLAFSNGLPAIPVSTLATQVVTAVRTGAVNRQLPVLSLLDARIGELYWALFDVTGATPVMQYGPEVCRPEDMTRVFGESELQAVGDGCRYMDQLPPALREKVRQANAELLPHAQDMFALAQAEIAEGRLQEAHAVSPVYVRDEISWKKLAEQGKSND
ncbi:MAG: tRNA (adenosine(37)-N6)-threonylcarbamoyltransferase complex dimerization subunit type 1 TsaB [Halieaceae bacterium]